MSYLENKIYKIVGLAVIVIFAVYIVLKMMTYQFKIIEGMKSNSSDSSSSIFDTTASKASDALNERNSKISDILAMDKYKTDYEDLIINLEDSINTSLFEKVVSISADIGKLDSSAVISDDTMKKITDANALNDFITSLNSSMKYIDSNSSSKTSAISSYFG